MHLELLIGDGLERIWFLSLIALAVGVVLAESLSAMGALLLRNLRLTNG